MNNQKGASLRSNQNTVNPSISPPVTSTPFNINNLSTSRNIKPKLIATSKHINHTIDFINNRKQKRKKDFKKNKNKHKQHVHTDDDATQSLINAIHSIQSWSYIQDNISTMTDIIKYKQTNHTLCDTHYFTRSMVGAHHKVYNQKYP